jgi:Protein of unknown function (DUF3313)
MNEIRYATGLRGALAALVLAVPASASAQTKDHAPVAMKSSAKMTQDKAQSESWTYFKPQADFTKYRSVIIDPTAVYSGPDAQFDGIEPTDRDRYAALLTDSLRSEVLKSFPANGFGAAQTLRIRVTLLGATKTKGGIATATRATTAGLALSAFKSIRGKPGALTGSLLLAVEAVDGETGEVLVAAVRRRNPDALDIPATLSTTDTVKAVARDFADNVRKRLEAAMPKPGSGAQ